MTLYAASPSMIGSSAGCQSAAACFRFDCLRTLVYMSRAALTSVDSQSVDPFHNPAYFSGPSSPSRTFSSRCSWVHSGPIVSGVTPAALSLGACSRNSLQVLGGPEMPAFSRTLGLYQSTLDRWMFTGTE